MKRKFIFIALVIGIILCSISTISANDVAINQTNEFSMVSDLGSVSNDSNAYSVNNVDIDNVVQSEKEDNQIVKEKSNKSLESTYINVSNIEMYFKNGTRFEAFLFDEQNNPLPDQKLVFTINGVNYNRTTNENGSASMAINLLPGNYLIQVNYEGTEVYDKSNANGSVKVLSNIIGKDIVKYYKNGTQYYATFLDDHGNPLVGAEVYFNINGVFYYRTTDENGSAKLNINLPPNEYILTAVHPNGYLYSNNVKVLSTINGTNLVKAYLDNHQYYATFLDGNGNPLVGAQVYFNINGVFYYRTTDENGSAKLNINLRPGQYILTAYNSNDGLLYSNNVTVLTGVDTIIDVSDAVLTEKTKQEVSLVLYDILGYTLPDKTVSLVIGDKTFNAITDENGVAYFELNLSAGFYNVFYQFEGTNVYGATGVRSAITVLKGKEVIIDALDDIVFKGNSFNVIVKDLDNNTVSGVKVVFIVNNQTYYRTTNDDGIASLVINLNPGLYLIVYYVNETGYDDSAFATTISVFTSNVTSLSSDVTEVYQGEGNQFSVFLSVDGTPLPNQKISIKINGVTYTRTTDAFGMAYITINLQAGEYIIDVSYNGTSKFNPTNKKFNLKVTKLISTRFEFFNYDIPKGSNFDVKLLDYYNNPLANKKIILTINGVNYTRTTNGDGIASIAINLNVGTYIIDCKFETDSTYGSCQESTEIRVIPNNVFEGNGYWLFGGDMLNVDLAVLSKQGTTDILLNYAAFTKHGEAKVLNWISKANSYGIKVHIWMQSFYNGEWILPVLADGTPNYAYFNQKINEAKYYAGLTGVSGIHLDYLRLPGTAYKHAGSTAAITEFVRLVEDAVKKINPNIILSAAVMPETTSNAYYYGQNVTQLGLYLDAIIPMIYKGNYKASTSWITTTTKWFVANSNGAHIWSGLQSYRSDSDVTPLPVGELTGDAQAAIDGGAKGAMIFRWGISKLIDFTSLDYPDGPYTPTGTEFSAKQIETAANNVKSYMEKNGVLPNYVDIDGSKCSMAQLLYLLSDYTNNFNTKSSFTVMDVSEPKEPESNSIRASWYSDNYKAIANQIISYINTYKMAPGVMSTSIGEIPYSALIYSYSKIVAFVGNSKSLPAFVYVTNIVKDYTLTVIMMPSVHTEDYDYIKYQTTWLSYCPHCKYYGTLLDNPKQVYEGEITCSYCDADYCGVTGKEKIASSNIYLTRLTEPVPVSPVPPTSGVSLDSIMAAAVEVKAYYEANKDIPDTIYISEGFFSAPQYLYLVSKAIVNIANSNFDDIGIIDAKNPSNPSGNPLSSQLDKSQYLDVANRVANFIVNNGQAPNFASSPIGNIIYQELVDAFSRVVAYYKNNGALPAYVAINYAGGSSKTISELAKSLIVNLTSTRDKATALFNYVRDYISYEFYYNTQKGAEGTLASGAGNCCDQSQLLVAMARSVGLTVRFDTGYCKFSSGSYGHVWTQFLVDGSWINADPTSTRNSFGVINNWDTKSYVDRGTYDILPY